MKIARWLAGLAAAIATLQKPVQPFDVTEFNTAYGLTGTAVSTFAARMAAAELMVRTGTAVVFAQDAGWDSHGDSSGASVRSMFQQRIAPGLRTFLGRMVDGAAAQQRNVVVAIFGDFHRSLPGSDHQANGAALVVGTQEVPWEEVMRYGIVQLKAGSADLEMEDVVEKPSREEAKSNLSTFGRFLLSPEIIRILKEIPLGKSNELWLTDAVREYVRRDPRKEQTVDDEQDRLCRRIRLWQSRSVQHQYRKRREELHDGRPSRKPYPPGCER